MFGDTSAESRDFAPQPGDATPVADREQSPQSLRNDRIPRATCRWITRGEEDLIARDAAHRFGVPGSEAGAADVRGSRLGHVSSADSERRASQAEVSIFQIAFECLFERASAREEIGAEEYGGPGRGGDFA